MVRQLPCLLCKAESRQQQIQARLVIQRPVKVGALQVLAAPRGVRGRAVDAVRGQWTAVLARGAVVAIRHRARARGAHTELTQTSRGICWRLDGVVPGSDMAPEAA